MAKGQNRINCIKAKRLRVAEAAIELDKARENAKVARDPYDAAISDLLKEIDDDRPLLDGQDS